MHDPRSVPTLSSRCQHSLALVVFLARRLLNGHDGTGHCFVALGFWSLGDFGGFRRFDWGQLFLDPPMFLFFHLFLLLLVFFLFLLLRFDYGALRESSELLVNGF